MCLDRYLAEMEGTESADRAGDYIRRRHLCNCNTTLGLEMKKEFPKHIVIAAKNNKGIDGQVSMHVGRCKFYVVAVVKSDRMLGFQVEKNPYYGNQKPKKTPVFIRDLGADAILVGGMDPKAVDLFRSFGIAIVTGAVGNVGKVLNAYLRGELKGIVSREPAYPSNCGDTRQKSAR